MTPEQEQKLNEVYEFIQSLKMSNSIPIEVEQAFTGRFPLLVISTKSASSENQTVDEGGTAGYDVLLPPDAFLKLSIGTTTYNIPAYT